MVSLLYSCLTIEILWKACFDFARIMGSVINYDILSHQNLIQSISTILNEDKEGLPVFRYVLRCLKVVDLCW